MHERRALEMKVIINGSSIKTPSTDGWEIDKGPSLTRVPKERGLTCKREREGGRGRLKLSTMAMKERGCRLVAYLEREEREKLPERGEMARARGEEKGNIQYLVLYFCTYSPPTLMWGLGMVGWALCLLGL